MKRWQFLMLMLVGSLALLVMTDRQAPEPDLEYYKKAVVVINADGVLRPFKESDSKHLPNIEIPWGGHGSGWLVSSDGYIVTNYHVIEKEEGVEDFKITVEIRGIPGMVAVPDVAYVNETFDIAVLKIEGNFPHYFKLSKSPPKLGQKVYAIGHPAGFRWTSSENTISNKGFVEYDNGSSHYVYQLNMPLAPGISGGVVFNKEGEVVCMPHIAMHRRDEPHTLFCIPSEDIERVLEFIGVK